MREGRALRERYQLERLLGRGGMADVYLAHDLRRQAYVAVKVLREDLAEDPGFLGRFGREAEALARLDHPYIVRFYSFERDGGTAFIVMDYVPGTTLRGRLAQAAGPLAAQEATEVLRQVGSALAYAHNEGYIHRDIKPGNIMLREDGTALLSDFGIARSSEATTMTTAPLGTPAYMSPEQILGREPTPQTDIYCLGVVLYEMVAGRRPFDGETGTGTTTSERVRSEQLQSSPMDPCVYSRALPAEASRVVLRALEKEPDRRWPDVRSMVVAWEQALGLEHVSIGRAASEVYAPQAWPAGCHVPAPQVPSTQLPVPVLEGRPPAVSRRQSRWPLWAAGAVGSLLLVVLVAGVALLGATLGHETARPTLGAAAVTPLPRLEAPSAALTAQGTTSVGGLAAEGAVPKPSPVPTPTSSVSVEELYNSAILVAHFDGPEPYDVDFAGDPNAATGQQARLEGGVIFGPGRFGKAVQIAEGTTNLMANPSLEVGTSDWKSGGDVPCELSSSDQWSMYGSRSLRVVWGEDGDRWVGDAQVSLPVGTYSLTFWAYNPGFDRQTVQVKWFNGTENGLPDLVLGPMEERLYSATFTTSGTTLIVPMLRPGDGVASEPTLFDGFQLEEKQYSTPYCDGSLGAGHSWVGQPNSSPSTRADASLSYAYGTSVNASSGSISLWAYFGDSWPTGDAMLFGLGTSAGNRFYLSFYAGASLYAAYVTTTGSTVSLATLPGSGWHYVAVTWKLGGDLAFYFDGALVGTKPMPASAVTGEALHIGAYYDQMYRWNGPIDELLIFRRPLTLGEIWALYTSPGLLAS